MQIVLGSGIGEVVFGMSKAQLFAQIGFPNKSYITEFGCLDAQYYALGLVLRFEPENDNRLGWIEVHNQGATVFGLSPWSMAMVDVLDLFSVELAEKPELDDYGSFESYFYNDAWVELQFALGRLTKINFGVLYDDNDSPLWPNAA